MATTDRTSQVHEKPVRQLLHLYSHICKGDLISNLITHGIIDLGRLNEVIDSIIHDVPLDSKKGRDLADGSDCKFGTISSTIKWSKYKNSRGIVKRYPTMCRRVTLQVKNVQGDLRVRLYDSELKKWHYGNIPHKELYSRKGKKVTAITIGVSDEGLIQERYRKYFSESMF